MQGGCGWAIGNATEVRNWGSELPFCRESGPGTDARLTPLQWGFFQPSGSLVLATFLFPAASLRWRLGQESNM